jgi:hypothetical protein
VASDRGDTDPHWSLAQQVAEAVLRRYPSQVHAIGTHGALAHGGAEGVTVELTVVTLHPGDGPAPTMRQVAGMMVDLCVTTVDERLAEAAVITPLWPLVADRYLATRAIYDPMGWHGRLRDTHLSRLAEATSAQFAAPARQAWCRAASARAEAVRLAQWHDTNGAMLALGQARLAAALVDGLLSRTYFHSSAEAVARTALGDATLPDLLTRLTEQAATLAQRGHPVTGEIADLLG